jgi:predicted nuclease of restriction endonuclease-like (RecB) superfamily
MSDQPVRLTQPPEGYAEWLFDLKSRIHTAQQRATLAVNRELVLLYWQIGRDILERQAQQGWGAKVIERLSEDLRSAFPEMKGFSRANLMYMRAFAEAWPDALIVQQAVGQLPWGHNLVILTRLKDPQQRLAYAPSAIEHGWARSVLNIHIETRLLERSGKAITNFANNLPKPQSDLARESLKDPYRLDFLGLGREAEERDIENALVKHVTEFLLELGAGFAFVGRQVLVNAQVKHPQDGPTIGMLLCKSKNKVVAEYALRDKTQPIGVAEYQLVESLPPELITNLPSIEHIERELANDPRSRENNPK